MPDDFVHPEGSPESEERGLLERIATAAVHVAALLLQIAAVALVVNAVYRYTVGGGFAVISEATRFSLLIVVFLGLAGTHIVGGHVKVELLIGALPQRLQSLLAGYLVPVVSIFYLGLLGWAGWIATAQMFKHGTTTPSPPHITLWPIALVIPLGCGLLAVILLRQMLGRLLSARSGAPAKSALSSDGRNDQ